MPFPLNELLVIPTREEIKARLIHACLAPPPVREETAKERVIRQHEEAIERLRKGE